MNLFKFLNQTETKKKQWQHTIKFQTKLFAFTQFICVFEVFCLSDAEILFALLCRKGYETFSKYFAFSLAQSETEHISTALDLFAENSDAFVKCVLF